ncbi:hypothetical protein ACHAPT_006112 [Fusarium lateritium]
MASSFEHDFIPALGVLSKFIEPHAKALLLLVFVMKGFFDLPTWSTLIALPAAVPAFLVAATYFWATSSLGSLASLVEPFKAFQAISTHVGTYFRVGALISLVCYIPIYYDIPLAFQPWIYCVFIALVATIGSFAPTSKFYGPLRFGYFEYSKYILPIYQFLVGSWVYLAVFVFFSPWLLPFAGLGLATTLLAAWVYIFRQYRKQLQAISDDVSQKVSCTQRAVTALHEYMAAARGYEQEMLRGAGSMREIAVQANAVRVSDFFDVAAKAWASLEQVTAPVRAAEEKAQALISAAEDVEDVDKPGEDDEEGDGGDLQLLAKYLSSSAQEAKDKASEVVVRLEVAQQAIRASKNAVEYDSLARADAESNASHAATAAQSLGTRVVDLFTREFEVTQGSDEVSGLAKQAVATATDGKMAKARELCGAVGVAADKVDALRVEARKMIDLAQEDLLTWLQSSRRGSRSVRYSDWEGSTAQGV